MRSTLALACVFAGRAYAGDVSDADVPGAYIVEVDSRDLHGVASQARALRTATDIRQCNVGSFGSTPSSVATGYFSPGSFLKNIVTCTVSSSGGTTLNGGSHALTVFNPNGDKVGVYSTDGKDCVTTQGPTTGMTFYAGWSGQVSFPAFTVGAKEPAPCRSNTCCTVLYCANSAAKGACSFFVTASFSGFTVPSPSLTPTVSNSGSVSPSGSITPSASPSRSPSKTNGVYISPTSSRTPSATPSPGPSDFDPRIDPKYASCYASTVLDQGSCGSCYALAAANVLSTALCRAVIDTNATLSSSGVFNQVSTMQAMQIYTDFWTDRSQYGLGGCKGGDSAQLLLSYAMNIHPQLNVTDNLLTCTSSSPSAPCLSGCYPYVAGACTSPAGGVVNTAGTTSPACSVWPVTESSCPCTTDGCSDAILTPSTGGVVNRLTPDAAWLTKTAKAWTAVPSSADEGLGGSYPKYSTSFKTAGGAYLYDNSLKNLFATNSPLASTGWSASDIKAVQSYLKERGPMAVAVSTCVDWNSQFDGPTCGVIGGVYTVSISAADGTELCCSGPGCATGSPLISFPGSTFLANNGNPLYYALATPNTAYKLPFAGASCGPTIDHAVTLVGWKTFIVNGNSTPAWILLNSWGSSWGDGGYFYLSIANGSLPTKTSIGGMAMQNPYGIAFVPANNKRRELAAAVLQPTLKEHARRMQAAAAAGITSPTGTAVSCESDASAVQLAATTSKLILDANKGVSFSNFVVHTLMCQTVSAATIYKAAVSAIDAITGDRVYAHVTFLYSPFGVPAIATNPSTGIFADDDGTESFVEHSDDGAYGGAQINEYTGPFVSKLSTNTGTTGRRRRLQVAAVGSGATTVNTMDTNSTVITYVVLNLVVLPIAAAAKDPSIEKPPVTNPNGLIDPIERLLGIEGKTAVLAVAAIILGTGVCCLIAWIVMHLWRYTHVLNHAVKHHHTIKGVVHEHHVRTSQRDINVPVGAAAEAPQHHHRKQHAKGSQPPPVSAVAEEPRTAAPTS